MARHARAEGERRGRVRRLIAVLAISVALSCMAAVAADEDDKAQVQNSFVGEVFNLQERSEVQLTLGSAVSRARGIRAGAGYFGMEYGLTGRLQAEFSLPFFGCFSSAETTQHVREIEFGVAYSVRKNPRRFAILPQVQFRHEYGAEAGAGMKVEPGLVVAQQLGATVLHLAASHPVQGGGSSYSAVLVRGWRAWRAMLELSRESGGGPATVQVSAGLVRTFRGRLREVGLGIPAGLRGEAPGWGFATRITFEFCRAAGTR